MWIATTRGFYSAVQHRDNHDDLYVRARSRADLESLCELAAIIDLTHGVGEIEDTSGPMEADYPYRIIVSKEAWAELLDGLTGEIDYPNFKDAVRAHQGPAREHLYHGVWSTLLRIEEEPDAGTRYSPPKNLGTGRRGKAGAK